MHLLFDIGGTSLRVATSSDGKTIENYTVNKTPRDFKGGMELLRNFLHEQGLEGKIQAVAGGFPGSFNKEKSVPQTAPNLPGWAGEPLKKALEDLTKAPVILENDAALAGVGESIYGAGKDFSIVAYLTVSTGVGGARIVDKKIDRSASGFEPGHQIISLGGLPVELEFLVSGAGLTKRYGDNFYEKIGEKEWDEVAAWLTYGLNNVIVHWSPDVVVLGGGVILKGKINFDKVKVRLREVLKVFPEIPPIQKATLGDQSVLYGALVILR